MSSGVEFDEDSFSRPHPQVVQGGYSPAGGAVNSGLPFSARNEPAMIRWLMRHHLAKSPAMAQGILIGLIIVNIIITYIVITYLL
jgi:hypothetical protein